MMPKAVWVYKFPDELAPGEKSIWLRRPKDFEERLGRKFRRILRRYSAHAGVPILWKYRRMPWGTPVPLFRSAGAPVSACRHCRELAGHWPSTGIRERGLKCPKVPEVEMRWAKSGQLWVLVPTWDYAEGNDKELLEKMEELWIALTCNGTVETPTIGVIRGAAELLQYGPGWLGSGLIARMVEFDLARAHFGRKWKWLENMEERVLDLARQLIPTLEAFIGIDK